MNEFDIVRHCIDSKNNFVTKKTQKVKQSHLKFGEYMQDGTIDEFKDLLNRLIQNGYQQSYTSAIFKTLRQHYACSNPEWKDPFYEAFNRNLISKAYRNLKLFYKQNNKYDLKIPDNHKMNGYNQQEQPHNASPSSIFPNYTNSQMPNLTPRNNTLSTKDAEKWFRYISVNVLDLNIQKLYNELESSIAPNPEIIMIYSFSMFFFILSFNGCRISEMLDLTIGQGVDLCEKCLYMQEYMKKDKILIRVPHGIVEHLRKYIELMKLYYTNVGKFDKNVIESLKLLPFSKGKYETMFSKSYVNCFQSPKPSGLGFHSIRKQFSYDMYLKNPKLASDILNHASSETTKRYYINPMIERVKQDPDYGQKELQEIYEDKVAFYHKSNEVVN